MGKSVNDLLHEYLEDESPTARRILAVTALSKLSAIQAYAEEMMQCIRTDGLDDALAQAKAIRRLFRIRELVTELESLLGVRPK